MHVLVAGTVMTPFSCSGQLHLFCTCLEVPCRQYIALVHNGWCMCITDDTQSSCTTLELTAMWLHSKVAAHVVKQVLSTHVGASCALQPYLHFVACATFVSVNPKRCDKHDLMLSPF